MSIVIVCKSKTGFTKTYAKWISEELDCDIINGKKVTNKILNEYETIIYGSGLYAGQIGGLKKFKSMVQTMGSKNLIVYATGATPANADKLINDMIKANFTEDEREMVPFFYFQSGLNYEKMSAISRIIMKMFASIMEKKSNKTEEEKGMAIMIKQSSDYTKKEYIVPLIEYVRSMNKTM